MKTVMISGFGCPFYLVSCFFLIIYEKRGKKEIKLRMVKNGRSASAIRLKNSE
jgi:hypothetical protein